MKIERMVIKLAQQHLWFQSLRNKALIIEYLMDQEFGDDFSNEKKKGREISARKIVRAQEIIEKMQTKRSEEKNDRT